jgi:uncharacterized protein YbjT (DUF2867 family)
MYAIIGASGHTGKVVAESLLRAGHQVTVIGRDQTKLSTLIEMGAKAAIGDISSPAFLESAFEGASAVYAMVPPNLTAADVRAYQNTVIDSIANGITKNGIRYVVTLSSIGAHLTEGAGVVQGLYDMEQKFNKIEGLNQLHLRAGFFFENFYGMMPLIKMMGVMGGFPFRGDLQMPIVHTRDIGQIAAEHLMNLNFEGYNYRYVAGERDLTLNEVVPILGKAIGNENLPYVMFPEEQAKGGMMQMGISESLADGYIEFSRACNDGSVTSDYVRNAENTTKTSVEEFAKEFAFAFQNS